MGPDPLCGSGQMEGRIPRRRHTVEQIIAKLREAEVALSKWPAGWHQRQSHPAQRRLVLVVQKICAERYGAGRARDESARGHERLVDRSSPYPTVGLSKGDAGREGTPGGYFGPSTYG
jgi:hypothetical protein